MNDGWPGRARPGPDTRPSGVASPSSSAASSRKAHWDGAPSGRRANMLEETMQLRAALELAGVLPGGAP